MNTMQVALRRRRTEIAMLKAAGYRRRDLYALFGLEAGLIGLVGGVVGTGIGLGAGVLIKGLVAHAVQTTVMATVDGAAIASGVAIGLCLALIFGLLPIAQASQVRPQAVLRDLPARADGTTSLQTAGLIVLLAILFWALASSVLGNPLVAAGVERRLVAALSAGAPAVAILAHLAPTTAAQTLVHLQDAVPSAQVRSLADQQAAVTANVDNAITVLIAVASLALLAGLIIIANAVALALLERRRDVGILKAVGQTSRGVLSEVLVETGVVGFTGAALALLLVAVATPLLGTLLFQASFSVPMLDVLLIVPATTIVCMFVAAVVAWKATHVRPLEVLRYE